MGIGRAIFYNPAYRAWLIREGQFAILARLAEIERVAKFSARELNERQLRLLQQTLSHAGESCQYYRRLFSERGFRPESFAGLEDLQVLPILNKAEINRNREGMLSKRHKYAGGFFESKTGGSTGTPMTFYRDKDCLLYRRALDHYFDRTIGFEIGEKQALLWGNPTDLPVKETVRHRLIERLVWRRISHLPVVLDERELVEFAGRIKRFRPKLLKAYPSLLHYFCEFVERKNLGPLNIPLVVATAEQLFDFQRELALRVLGCEVFEKYGAREIGTAAVECSRHDGLHLMTESLYVEVEPVEHLAEKGVGKLIITDLRNRAMPLIRYEVGDLAELDSTPCRCGLPFPRLKNIQGRATDLLYRRDGTPLAGLEATDAITYSGLTTQAQIVQEEPGELEVRVVNLKELEQSHIDYIHKRLLTMLGQGGRVIFSDVDRIDRDRSGKFRYVLSRVKGADAGNHGSR